MQRHLLSGVILFGLGALLHVGANGVHLLRPEVGPPPGVTAAELRAYVLVSTLVAVVFGAAMAGFLEATRQRWKSSAPRASAMCLVAGLLMIAIGAMGVVGGLLQERLDWSSAARSLLTVLDTLGFGVSALTLGTGVRILQSRRRAAPNARPSTAA